MKIDSKYHLTIIRYEDRYNMVKGLEIIFNPNKHGGGGGGDNQNIILCLETTISREPNIL